jgi:hypothetical protein
MSDSNSSGCSSAHPSPDDMIDVWEITPHLNTDYDAAIYDSPERVIEYFRDLAEAALDSLGHGDGMTITITHKSENTC